MPNGGPLDPPANHCLTEPPKPAALTTEQDRKLVDAAADILHDARKQGIRLSQAALARQLRARGHSIANQRLRWLTSTTAGI
jgi:hypothetical protein